MITNPEYLLIYMLHQLTYQTLYSTIFLLFSLTFLCLCVFMCLHLSVSDRSIVKVNWMIFMACYFNFLVFILNASLLRLPLTAVKLNSSYFTNHFKDCNRDFNTAILILLSLAVSTFLVG